VGKFAVAMAKTGLGIPGADACPSDAQLPMLLDLTADEDPRVRRLALKHLCPCRLRREREPVWTRVFELLNDPDPGVRMDAIHAMTDGSPREYGPQIVFRLRDLRNDPDPKVRRYVRRTLATIARTGRVNVN
jgi:HEAT repeat protein